jgi:hypothetical protein
MMALGAGSPTRAICSTLIAQAFHSLRYPILPQIQIAEDNLAKLQSEYAQAEILHIRNHTLFTPHDFDISSYFSVLGFGGIDPKDNKDNGRAIRQVCTRFVTLCRTMGLLAEASVAIDGSKFKAVNNRDKNFTRAKMQRRMAQIEESVARYLHQL